MLRNLAAVLLLSCVHASAVNASPRHDANILTAMDFSESVSVTTLRRQVRAISASLRSRDFMRAIKSGPRGQIGFAVYCWYHEDFPTIVPWHTISSREEALHIAGQLDRWAEQDLLTMTRVGKRFPGGRYTNLAKALVEARARLDAAPVSSVRNVVNIVGNGPDNLHGDVPGARDGLLSIGATVNGVVPRDADGLDRYYAMQVIGGPGAFVIRTDPAEELERVMTLKFRLDMVASRSPEAGVLSIP